MMPSLKTRENLAEEHRMLALLAYILTNLSSGLNSDV